MSMTLCLLHLLMVRLDACSFLFFICCPSRFSLLHLHWPVCGSSGRCEQLMPGLTVEHVSLQGCPFFLLTHTVTPSPYKHSFLRSAEPLWKRLFNWSSIKQLSSPLSVPPTSPIFVSSSPPPARLQITYKSNSDHDKASQCGLCQKTFLTKSSECVGRCCEVWLLENSTKIYKKFYSSKRNQHPSGHTHICAVHLEFSCYRFKCCCCFSDYAAPALTAVGKKVGSTFRPPSDEGYTTPFTSIHYDTPGSLPEYAEPLPPEPEYATPFSELPSESKLSTLAGIVHSDAHRPHVVNGTLVTPGQSRYDCPAHRTLFNGYCTPALHAGGPRPVSEVYAEPRSSDSLLQRHTYEEPLWAQEPHIRENGFLRS